MELIVEAGAELDIRSSLARAVLDKGWDLLELAALQVSLEDVFIDLVTEETEDDAAPADGEHKEVA